MGTIKIKTTSIACALLGAGLLFSNLASAAVVEINSPAGPGETSYTIPGDSTVYEIYQSDTPDGVIVDPADNGGVEFILLGVHETIVHESNDAFNNCIALGNCNDTVEVNLDSTHPGGVSNDVVLLLSAAESLNWNINFIDPAINLLSVYVFASDMQTVNFNNGSASVITGEGVCSFSYPEALGGCQTDELLGIETDNNFLGLINILDDETSLDLTSYNGTYFADGFDVTIDSTPIPLPAAWLLFGSALMGLGLGKSRTK